MGSDFGIAEDLSDNLPDSWRPFNKQLIPKFLEAHHGKSKVAAG